MTWNQEAGAVVPKPLGMAAGRQHGLNGKVHVLPHGKRFRKTLIKLSGRLLKPASQASGSGKCIKCFMYKRLVE